MIRINDELDSPTMAIQGEGGKTPMMMDKTLISNPEKRLIRIACKYAWHDNE